MRAVWRAVWIAVFVIAGAIVLNPKPAAAACACACVEGKVEAICSNSIEIKPICPPRVCPITPPRVQPLPSLRIPPIGTSSCQKVQVYNDKTQQYEFQEVCR